jgi:hypothetical protein
MSPEQQARVVDSYIASSKLVWDTHNVLRPGDESSWASDTLYSLAPTDPALCLSICDAIATRDSSDQLLERLANGPLSEVLKNADSSVLSAVEAFASNHAPFRELLSYVWEDHAFSPATWAVIRRFSA